MSNQDTKISLSAYAAVLAGLGAGLRLPRALLHAGVEPLLWDEASEEWQDRIEESAASDLEVLVAFDGALLAEKRRFEPIIEPVGSDAVAFAHFRRHVLTAVDAVAFLADKGLSLASYARLEADWAARALTDEAVAAVLEAQMRAPMEACPALHTTPSPLLARPEEDRPAPRAAVASPEPPKASMPPLQVAAPVFFDAPSSPLLLPTLPEPPLPVPSSMSRVGMTGALDISLIRAALPFAGESTAPLSPAPPALPALGPTDIGMTGALPADLVARLAKGQLPFAKGSSAPLPPPVAPAPEGGPSPDPGSTTGPIPALHPVNPALPFQPSAAPATSPAAARLPTLSLEQYACLCAELAFTPADAEGIFHRAGLGPTSERIAADLAWQERLRRNPAEYQRWQEAYQ
ncbi:MAG: hypothetical protein ABI193_18705, partial [Minicystis sp.]